ncbi:potassium channel subfamily K member 18 [Pelodytes ibericus]
MIRSQATYSGFGICLLLASDQSCIMSKKGQHSDSDRIFWTVFPHVCLVGSVVLYSIIGAFLFEDIEGSKKDTSPEFDKFLEELWNISQSSCSAGGKLSEPGLWPEQFINSSRFLITHDIDVEWLHRPEFQWDFLTSLFFCCTVFTTIGYGHLSPVTLYGRIACMLYAAIGIPLMLLLLADLGDILAGLFSKVYKGSIETWSRLCHRSKSSVPKFSSFRKSHSGKSSLESTLDSRVSMREPLNLTDVLKSQATVKKNYQQMSNIDLFELIIIKEHPRTVVLQCNGFQRCHSCPNLKTLPHSVSAINNFDKLGTEVDQLDVPITLILLVVVAYIMFGALILPLWEDEWTTIDAFYFCFITLTTIGFGDVLPKHPNYFLLLSAYIVIGMAIMCMAFKLLQNRMVSFYKQCMFCISRGKVDHDSDKPDLHLYAYAFSGDARQRDGLQDCGAEYRYPTELYLCPKNQYRGVAWSDSRICTECRVNLARDLGIAGQLTLSGGHLGCRLVTQL